MQRPTSPHGRIFSLTTGRYYETHSDYHPARDRRVERAERRRVQSNNEVLTDSVEFYRTESGKHAASRQVLELRASEMERYNAQLTAQVRELRIKVRRLEAAATTATRTEVQITQARSRQRGRNMAQGCEGLPIR